MSPSPAMGAIILAVMALVASQAAANSYMPVIQIGAACAAVCAGMDTVLPTTCVRCIIGAGWVPVWGNASQPMYSIKRMPLVENNLPYAVAVPLMQGDAWIAAGASQIFYNQRQVYPDLPKNVTICIPDAFGGQNCITRNMGPTAIIRNSSSPTGYCLITHGWLNLDPACDGTPNPYNNVNFNTPEQLASTYATGQNGRMMDAYLPYAQTYARALMTDVNVAADAIWKFNSVIWSSTMFFKKADSTDLPFLREQFGADWTSSMTNMLLANQLIMMDLATWMYDLKLNLSDTQMQPGALLVLQKRTDENNQFVPRCIIFKLFDTGMKRVSPEVYTPTKSATAWLIAMVYARSAIVFHQIRIGHFYTYHVVGSAQHYALYNAIDAGVPAKKSIHPIRMLLDEWTEPLIQNHIQLGTYTGASDPPYVSIKSPYYPQMHNQFVASGGPLGNGLNDLWGLTPRRMAERSGLNVSDFTSTNGKPWDLYEQMSVHIQIYDIIQEYATTVVKAYYKSDNEFKSDSQLMNFIAALTDPMGSNLGQLNKWGGINSRSALGELMANIIYRPVIHATLHLLDYFKGSLNIVAGPTRIDKNFFPSPTTSYTIADMMALMPDTYSTAQQLSQAFNIGMVSPQGGPWLVKIQGSDEIDFNFALPFYASPKGSLANAAARKFRKDVTDLIYNWPVLSCCLRQTAVNFNWPMEMTTHIDF